MRKILLICLPLFFAVFLGLVLPGATSASKLSDFHFWLRPVSFHFPTCPSEQAGLVRCHARVVTDSHGQPQTTTSLPSGYGPAQFQTAYNLSGKSANGRTLAIVDAYDQPNIASDLAVYDTTFSLSAPPSFTKVNQTGGTTYPAANSGWGLEISLDVEAAHAACPDCKLLLVEANSASYADLMAAEDKAVALGASVVSNSYGSREFSGETAYDSHFNHPGVAFTFSSGDSGYGSSYPAASRYVTSVGGTSLYVNSNNSWSSERVWSGTGSGCSAYETKPSFQHDTGCKKRTENDVAADADPYTGAAVYDSLPYAGRSGWFQVGGTSLASPLIAAAYALGSVGPSVQANSLPYGNISALHDITAGSNGHCSGTTKYLCTAGPGYDGPTGFGTPNGVAAF